MNQPSRHSSAACPSAGPLPHGASAAADHPAADACGTSAPPNLLTFDVEEYFQVEGVARSVGPGNWSNWPQRLQPPVERILQLLADHRTRATFFILGWVARHEAHLVRRIADAGHEIASHGMSHAMLHRLSPEQFRRELLDSRALLQDLSGQPIIGYRAPTFSINHRTAWAFDQLRLAGYCYDSSVFTVRHDRYGVPEAPPGPHLAACAVPSSGPADPPPEQTILEIPPLTLPLGRLHLPVGGGGYLRLLPVRLTALAIRRRQAAGLPAMVYLHPWELDPGQPLLPMPRLQRWRHRIGLAGAEAKLASLLRAFRFAAVADCLPTLNALARDRRFLYGRQQPTA